MSDALVTCHLNDGSGRPACVHPSGPYVTREEFTRAESVADDGVVEEIHLVTCEACKKLFREAVEAGRALRAAAATTLGADPVAEAAKVELLAHAAALTGARSAPQCVLRPVSLFADKAGLLERVRVRLELIEDLQETARRDVEAKAALFGEEQLSRVLGHFDQVEKNAYALLRLLQEFQS